MTENNKQITNDNDWSMTIKPKRHLFEINLKEIWNYRDLITLFVRRDFVAKYKQTILGPLWFIIQPLLTTIMFTVIFGKIAKLSTQGMDPMLFYMSGVVGWSYFAASLKATSSTFTANANIFGKVYFPRLAIPISSVISGLVQFIIQFAFLIAFMIFYWLRGVPIAPNATLFLIPVLILLMAGLGLGFGIIISSMTTKYRDLTNLVGFGIQLWMYATPIIYPLSKIPEKYKAIIIANPMTSIVEAFRHSLLGIGEVNYLHLAYSGAFMIFVLVVGILMFNKIEQSFMDTV